MFSSKLETILETFSENCSITFRVNEWTPEDNDDVTNSADVIGENNELSDWRKG